MKFCWTTLHVSNLENSLKFYHEILGLGPIVKFGVPGHEIVMLGDDGCTKLELICEDAPLPEVRGGGVSVGFAFENVDELVSKLRNDFSMNVAGPVTPGPNVKFYFVTDPDGYTVQLL